MESENSLLLAFVTYRSEVLARKVTTDDYLLEDSCKLSVKTV